MRRNRCRYRAPVRSGGVIDAMLVTLRQADGNAKIWQYRLRQDTWRAVATVNDASGESIGIVDVSEWFGGGAWLLNVQAHGSTVDEAPNTPTDGITSRLESGQMMLLKIPGS